MENINYLIGRIAYYDKGTHPPCIITAIVRPDPEVNLQLIQIEPLNKKGLIWILNQEDLFIPTEEESDLIKDLAEVGL
jgi:hypothetical protein